MSKSQRNKGSAGERELFKLLSDELGFVVKRNLSQTRGGGADCIEIPGWSVECKRQEKLNIGVWWDQTLNQCKKGEKPILFFRQSRQPWKAIIRLTDLEPGNKTAERLAFLFGDTAMFPFETACKIIRESL